jgi:hypothetical protein
MGMGSGAFPPRCGEKVDRAAEPGLVAIAATKRSQRFRREEEKE